MTLTALWLLILLTILLLLVGGMVAFRMYRTTREPESKGVTIRTNVLLLLGIAYGSIIAIFGLMIWQDVEASTAYEAISVPFVALIGGTLTVVKDLID